MNKIINPKEAITISAKLKREGKTIVLTGGCFDIVHIGHIKFLRNAKKEGDVLFILLESDKTVRKLKGRGRPIYNQKERAEVLAQSMSIDYVVMLPEMKNNQDYDNLISNLKPDVIATTKNDPQGIHNERQAKKINARVAYVMNRVKNKSTTVLAELISKHFEK